MINAFFGISSLPHTFHLVLLGPYELWDSRACQHSHQKLSRIEFNKQEATYKNIESEKWHTKAELAFAAEIPICRWVLHCRQKGEPMFSGLQSGILWCGASTLIPPQGLCHLQSTQDPSNCAVVSRPSSAAFLTSCYVWKSTFHASKNQWKRTRKERTGVDSSQCHLCSSTGQCLPFLSVSVWSAWWTHLRVHWDLSAQSDSSPCSPSWWSCTDVKACISWKSGLFYGISLWSGPPICCVSPADP